MNECPKCEELKSSTDDQIVTQLTESWQKFKSPESTNEDKGSIFASITLIKKEADRRGLNVDAVYNHFFHNL